MDEQTAFSSLDRVCIPCSAVKMLGCQGLRNLNTAEGRTIILYHILDGDGRTDGTEPFFRRSFFLADCHAASLKTDRHLVKIY